MASEPRLTLQTLLVLREMSAAPGVAGSDLTRRTGVKSGTLYPMLRRLEAAGWLSATREAGSPQMLGRPLRRLYRMTTKGTEGATAAMNQVNGTDHDHDEDRT